MNPLFQIPKRGKICKSRQEPLLAGMDYISALVEHGNQMERQDFCAVCWDQLIEAKAFKSLPIYWKSKVLAKKESTPVLKNRGPQALELFKSLINEENRAEDCFVLALYLARKRLIALRKEVFEKGILIQLYEILETEEVVWVKKMKLSSLQIEAVQQRIAKQLQSHVPVHGD